MDPSDLAGWSATTTWERTTPNTFRLPQGLNVEELTSEVLYVGGYQLYSGSEPIPSGALQIDAWRTDPATLAALAQTYNTTALVFAYFDNDSWRVVFSTAEGTRVAAACR
jgi:hypothetical protein